MYRLDSVEMLVKATPIGTRTKSPGTTSTTPCWVTSTRFPLTWYWISSTLRWRM